MVSGSEGDIRAIRLPLSVNQRPPSDPPVMNCGFPSTTTGNSVTSPAVVTRPILLVESSVNQSAPSGPTAMATGMPKDGNGVVSNSVKAPDGVIRPILYALLSVNHRLPSGPGVMPSGLLNAGSGNCVNC